jgi:hypothetical protein
VSAGEWVLVLFVLTLYGALALVLFAANHHGRSLRAWYRREPVDLDRADGVTRPEPRWQP